MEKFLPPNIIKLIKILLIVIILFLAAETVSLIKGYRYIGAGPTPITISFEGKGEVTATPDIATISFSLRQEAKTAKDAQILVSGQVHQALAFLKESGVVPKDIKTTNYSSYPKYDYSSRPCSQNVCPPGKQILTGYEVSENIEVKIRKIDEAGKIVEGLAKIGVTDMEGPHFAIAKEVELKNQARTLAISDAKAKAQELARELKVRLVRIVNFVEGGANPYPIYAKAAPAGAGAAPELPKGENKIISNITITYEIR